MFVLGVYLAKSRQINTQYIYWIGANLINRYYLLERYTLNCEKRNVR
jgi:hypothetical protein